MARFDSYRNLLKNFKKEIEGVYSKQSDEIEYVNKNYKPEAVGNAVKNVKAEYAPSFLAIRKNYLNKLNDVTEALKKKNSSKYIDNYVNKPFLETLNLIAAAGIPLTTYLGIFREIRQATKESQLPTDQSRRADLITTEKSLLEIHYIMLELLSQQKARKKCQY